MGKIIGICISEKRGTSKHPVDEAVICEGWGRKKSMRSAGKALRLSLELLEKI